jgi:hypothetical protein
MYLISFGYSYITLYQKILMLVKMHFDVNGCFLEIISEMKGNSLCYPLYDFDMDMMI